MNIPKGIRIVRGTQSLAARIAENNRRCLFAAERVEVPSDIALRGVEYALSLPNCVYFLLMNTDDEILAQYKQVHTWNDYYARPTVWMEHLYVEANYRKMGFGTLLVDHFFESTRPAPGDPSPFLVLLVHRNNHQAINLYAGKHFDEMGYDWMGHRDALGEAGYEPTVDRRNRAERPDSDAV